MRAGHKKQLLSVFALAALVASPANAAVIPDSGTVLQGNQPRAIQQPTRQAPAITVKEKEVPEQESSGQTVLVSGFRFTGQLPVLKEELTNLIADKAGRSLTLTELNRIADRITQHLRQQGYLVAFAYIPAQTLQDGMVEITVVPGKYGEIKIDGQTRISPERLKGMLFAAQPGKVIRSQELERALLLLNDLSGIAVQASLSPGKNAGTADLTLKAVDTGGTSGVFYADNWGNRYSGQVRSGVQVNIHNPGGRGDQLTVGGLLSQDRRMNDYNLSYSVPVGRDGARLSLGHSRVHYTLGEEYASLKASGEAITDTLSLSYPLVRSRVFNLLGTVDYDHKKLNDDMNSTSSFRKTSRVGNTGLSGNFSDRWLGGGYNSFALTQYWGSLDSNDNSANAAAHFAKTVLTFQRQQIVTQNLNFNFNFTGQLADNNLDSSEKLFLGGADGVRAFPQGEASGDQGYKLTGEFRWQLPGLSKGKQHVYLTNFYDYGNVMVNKKPSSSDDNRRSLMGMGLGLLWTRDSDFSLRLDYAWKIGKETAQGDTDKSGRFWLQGVKYF